MSTLADDSLDPKYIQHLNNITSNWNNKKSFNSNVLSGLVPFVKLYATFRPNNFLRELLNNIPSNEKYQIWSNDRAFGIGNSSDDSDTMNNTEIQCIEFGRLESQMQNEKGGVGINSLTVNRTTAECFTIKFQLSMTITDSSIFNNQAVFNQIMTLNSGFIIVHGWDGYPLQDDQTIPVITPVPGENPTDPYKIHFNKEHKNNTFWDYNYVKLYRFNFNVTSEGHLLVNLGFVNSDSSHLEFSNIRNISNIVLSKIKEPSVDTDKITDTSVIGAVDGFERLFYNIISKDNMGETGGTLITTNLPGQGAGPTAALNSRYRPGKNIPVIDEFNYSISANDYPYEAVRWRASSDYIRKGSSNDDDGKPYLYGFNIDYDDDGEIITTEKESIDPIITDAPIVFNKEGLPVRATTNDQDGYYFLNNLQIDLEGVKIVSSSTESKFYNTTVKPVYGGVVIDKYGDKSALQHHIDHVRVKFSSNTDYISKRVSEIETHKNQRGWPYQSSNDSSPLKPLTITSAQYQLFLDSKQDTKYGVQFLQRIIDNDEFISANKDTIFKQVIDEQNRKNFFQEKINRGTIIFSNIKIEDFQLTEEENIDAPTAGEQSSEINVNEIETNNLRIKFVDIGRHIYNQLIAWDITSINHFGGVGGFILDNNDNVFLEHLKGLNEIRIANDDDQLIQVYEIINDALTRWFLNLKNSLKEEWDNTVSLGNSFIMTNEIPEEELSALTDKNFNLNNYNILIDNDIINEARSQTDNLLNGDFVDSILEFFGVVDTVDRRGLAAAFSQIVVSQDSEPVCYYLGPVLEAIIETLNDKDENLNNDKIVFQYQLIPRSLKEEIARIGFNVVTQINGRSRSLNISNSIETTFDLPIDYKSVDNLLTNRNLNNLSTSNLLKDILLTVNSGILSAIPPISLEYRPRPELDGNVYELYIASDNIRNITNQIETGYAAGQYVLGGTEENRTIDFNFGESNSLVETFNISSKIDPLTFAAFRLPTNFGLTNISLKQILLSANNQNNFIKKILEDAKRGEGALFDIIINEGGDVTERITNIQKFLEDASVELSDEINNDITSLLLKENDLFLGLISTALRDDENSTLSSDLLVNFLFNIDATIHGTTGLFLFDPVIVNNFVANSGGVYIINSVQENISPSFFTTSLNLKLHVPFDARSGVTSRQNSHVSVSGDVHAPVMLRDEQYPDFADTTNYIRTYKINTNNGPQYRSNALFYPPPPRGNAETGPFYTQAGYRVYPSVAPASGRDK